MLACLIAVTSLAAPQSEGPSAESTFGYPADPATVAVTPFRDATGQPLAHAVGAAGTADLTGGGPRDAWFLAGSGPLEGELAVHMTRLSDPGRYRPWFRVPGTWTGAATMQHRADPRAQLLLTAPGMPGLYWGEVRPGPGSDPRVGAGWVHGPSNLLANTPGLFAVTTRDRDGDGFEDEIVALQASAPGETTVHLVVLDATRRPALTATSRLPFSCRDPVPCEIDGNAHTDVLLRAGGAGIVLLQGHAGGLRRAALVPDANGVFHTVTAGRLRAADRDTVVLVTDRAPVLGTLGPTGWQVEVLTPPAGALPLGHAEVHGGELPGLVAVRSDGEALATWRFQRHPGPQWLGPWLEQPARPRTGSGPLGRPAVLADADADGDRDLLVQRAGGATWSMLRNPTVDLAPTHVTFRNLGPIGTSGYLLVEGVVHLPLAWTPAHYGTVELHAFVRNLVQGRDHYWGRLQPTVDPVRRTATFHLMLTKDPLLVQLLHSNPPDPASLGPTNFTIGGEIQISVHGRRGSRRLPARWTWFDPDDGGNKSAQGVKWKLRAAPPLPSADDALLPWN